MAGESMLKKKAEEAKAMRDFMAYKQFQKELDKNNQQADKQQFYKQIDDANRK
jgi:hypothetical protein